MKNLPFLPFGAQYYRAPTPLRDAWAPDFMRMSRQGINTVKLWLCWRSNNPREGVYDFSDIDELMRLAELNGLKVILNTIFDTAPAWFFQKYPESIMQTNGVGPIHPTATACRQMGGAPGPCYHHRPGIDARRALLIEAARRYRDHPALMYWDLWNEPEHTCAIKRQPTVENLTCYCDHSVLEFRRWLREKYGAVSALNCAWGRNYQDYEEVEVPRLAEAFNDMIDWRLFMTDAITQELRMRVQAIQSVDQAHSVMVHTVTLPFFPLATCGSDDYALARQCDLFGNSVGSEPLSAAITLSAAEDKVVINAEIHAVAGSTYSRPRLNGLEDMKRHLFVPLGLGIKGFLFWQYRPERLGLESPAWGLTAPDGGMTPWLDAALRINGALQAHAEVIRTARKPACDIAILSSQKAQLFDFCVNQGAMSYARSVQGAYSMLRALGYAPALLSDAQIDDNHLAGFRLIYDPFPYYKDAARCRALKRWVAGGGKLIAEACFGGYSADDGLHSTSLPGFGFDEVFGANEAFATSARHFSESLKKDCAAQGDAPGLRFDGGDYSGALIVQALSPAGAEVIARYEDGSAAITLHAYGDGAAVWIGTLPALAYQAEGRLQNVELIQRLIELLGCARPALDADRINVCATLLDADNGQLVVIDNASCEDGVALKCAPGALRGKWFVDILTGDRFSICDVLPVKAGCAQAYHVQ